LMQALKTQSKWILISKMILVTKNNIKTPINLVL
jgi:hypothetical protein